jgi:5-hydroxyisourate hydrolase-like protein (transthyretin family)
MSTRAGKPATRAVASVAIGLAMALGFGTVVPASAATVAVSGHVAAQGKNADGVFVWLYKWDGEQWSRTSGAWTNPAGNWTQSSDLADGSYALWYYTEQSEFFYTASQRTDGSSDNRWTMKADFTVTNGVASTTTFDDTLDQNGAIVRASMRDFDTKGVIQDDVSSNSANFHFDFIIDVGMKIDVSGVPTPVFPPTAQTATTNADSTTLEIRYVPTEVPYDRVHLFATNHHTEWLEPVTFTAGTVNDLGTFDLYRSSAYPQLNPQDEGTNDRKVAISGTAQVGSVLTASDAFGGTSTYTWYKSLPLGTPGSERGILIGSGPAFTVPADAAGWQISASAIVRKAGYGNTRIGSDPTALVPPVPVVPQAAKSPVSIGVKAVGKAHSNKGHFVVTVKGKAASKVRGTAKVAFGGKKITKVKLAGKKSYSFNVRYTKVNKVKKLANVKRGKNTVRVVYSGSSAYEAKAKSIKVRVK